MKSRILIILVFAGVMGGLGLVALVRARQLAEVKVAPVLKPAVVRAAALERRDFTVKESFYGLIEAEASIDMAFQVPGRVHVVGKDEKSKLTEGDVVEQGQLLAQLEPLRFQANVEGAQANEEVAAAALAGSKADYAQAVANLQGTQAVLQDAEAKLEDAELEYKKLQDIAKVGGARPRDIEKAAVAVKLAKANIARVTASIKGAEAMRDAAKAKVDAADATYRATKAQTTIAEVNQRDAKLFAPRRALVAELPVEVGQMVQPGQKVIRLVALDAVRLVVGVVESKSPLLKVNQKVDVEVLALRAQAKRRAEDKELGRIRRGKVVVVPPAADQRTGLFNVEIELDNKDGALKPGMVGKALVRIETRRGFAVPAEAVTRRGDQLTAYFVETGYPVGLDMGSLGRDEVRLEVPIAKLVRFQPIVSQKDFYLIDKAPDGYTKLIIEGQSRLTEGQPLTVIDSGLIGRVE